MRAYLFTRTLETSGDSAMRQTLIVIASDRQEADRLVTHELRALGAAASEHHERAFDSYPAWAVDERDPADAVIFHAISRV